MPVGKTATEVLSSGLTPDTVQTRPYREYVLACADALLEHGTARYGGQSVPMLVTYLDVRTRECPENPPVENPYWRGQLRDCFWKPRGADLFADMTTLDVLHAASGLTGHRKYAAFAEDYCRFIADHPDDKGFFWWGWHRHYDVFENKWVAPNCDFHEIHVHRPRWNRLHAVCPAATEKALEAVWQWHVINKETGEHNRHGTGQWGCDFAMSGGEFVYALATLHRTTGETLYLDGAKLVMDYHWSRRDPKTGLTSNQINVGRDRFDGCHFDTSITGVYCYFLLKTSEMLGDTEFRDKALDLLRAYATYGYDETTGRFWGSLRLDGTPEIEDRGNNGYGQYEPKGAVDLWQPYMLGYEFPIRTAQTYAYAYQLSGEPLMLETARKWANWIRKCPPETGCRYAPTCNPEGMEDLDPATSERRQYHDVYAPHGTFADLYGQTVSFFLHLYALTDETEFLDDAQRFANEAVSKLYYNGLFRGHPCKPYYGSVDGVGTLLYALLQLDGILEHKEKIRGQDSILLADGATRLGFDNW